METTCKQKTEMITNKSPRGFVNWYEILTLEQNQDTPVDIGDNLKIFEFSFPPVSIGSGCSFRWTINYLNQLPLLCCLPYAGLLGAFALKQTQIV